MPDNINEKIKEQYDHDSSGGSLNTNLGDFLDSESASGDSINTQWRNWAEGTGTSLNTRLFNKHGGSGSFMTRWKNWIAFSSTHSFNFDGSNDYLNCGSDSSLDDIWAGGGTLSAWIYPNSDGESNFGMIANKRGGGSVGWIFHLNDESSGSCDLRFYQYRATTAGDWITTSREVTINAWNHIVISFDSDNTSNNPSIYVNGTLVSLTQTGSQSGAIASDASKDLNIGGEAGAYTFDGLIDEVAIWDVALDSSDITSVYNNGKIIDLSKSASYGTDRTGNLKLWLRCGDKAEPESTTSIARSDFYTDFDGTNDYVLVGDSSDLGFADGQAFSVSLWFNTTASGDMYLLDNRGGGSTTEGFAVILNASGTNYLGFIADGANSATVTNTVDYNDGNWHHLAFTWNGTDTITSYIDGSSVGTATQALGEVDGTDLYIGKYSANNSNYWNGKISNLSIYQTAIDAKTIQNFAKSRYTPMRDNRFSVVDFDGTNDTIDTNVNSTPADATYIWWMKATGTNTNAVFGHGTSSQTGFILNWAGTNKPLLYLNSSNYRYFSLNDAQDDGAWHCFALVNDNDDILNAKLYIDGVEQSATSTTYTGPDPSHAHGLKIGYAGSYFEGSIAQFAIYSDLKDSDFIYAQWSKGITANFSSDTNLIAYYRMGSDTSKAYPTIADSSSNSNDGTITNGASDDIVQQAIAMYDMGAFESTGQELGGEIASNNFGGWTLNGWTDNGDNTASANNSSGGNQDLTISYSFTASAFYKITATFSNISGTFYYNLDATGALNKTITTNGEHILYVQAPSGGSGSFLIRSSNGSSATISNVSLKEVLQSADLSDTYPAIIDVNEPVLGAELFTNGWTNDGNGSSYPPYSGSFSYDASANTVTATSGSSGTYVTNETFRTEFTAVANAFYKITFTTSNTNPSIQFRGLSSGNHLDTQTSTPYYSPSSLGNADQVFYLKANASATRYIGFRSGNSNRSITVSNFSIKQVSGNVGLMTNQDSADLVYSSVLPDQSFLTGVNSAYNFIDLDGADQYIDAGTALGTSLGDNYAGDLSISIWFKSAGFGNDGLFNIGDFSSTNGEITILIYNNELGFHLNNIAWRVKVTSFSDTSWNHLFCVYKSGSESDTNMYLNGSSVGSKSGTFPSASDIDLNGLKTIIGAYSSASTPFNGDMGQVAIWNKDISSDVGSIYNAGRHTNLLDSYSDNLKGYWAMSALDAITGFPDSISTIYDRSGNTNNGIPDNADAGDLKSSPNAEPNGYSKGDTNRSTTKP